MQFSFFLPSTLAVVSILYGVKASPQPSISPRQLSPSTTISSTTSSTSISSISPASTFSYTVATQCYTSRASTQLMRSASTASSVSYISSTSIKNARATVTVTPTTKTKTVTFTAVVTVTFSPPTNGIATVMTTSTTVQATTLVTTSTTTTTSTSTLTPTTISTSSGFQPAGSTIPTTTPAPGSGFSKRHLGGLSNHLQRRQHGWGNRPHYSWDQNRHHTDYPGDVTCLTTIATGTISTRIRTTTSIITPSTALITTTSTRTTTISPSSSISATSTTTITAYTTSTVTFQQTHTSTQTETTTISMSPSVMPTTYAACTLPANNIARLGTPGNLRPIASWKYDTDLYSGDKSSPYACCVSAIMNPFGAMWAWSQKSGCFVFVVQNTAGSAVEQCPGGQAAFSSTRRGELDVGAVGDADMFTVGNANCGDWNAVGSA